MLRGGLVFVAGILPLTKKMTKYFHFRCYIIRPQFVGIILAKTWQQFSATLNEVSIVNDIQTLDFKEFIKLYRFDIPVTERDICVAGYVFSSIGNNKSGWPEIDSQSSSGFLYQTGEITLVNPDRNASIAFLNLSNERYLYCCRRKFENNAKTCLTLSVFPRELPPGATGERAFALDLVYALPKAHFINSMTQAFVPYHGISDTHCDFIQRKLGDKSIAKYGLVIQKIRNSREDLSPLEELLNSDRLSKSREIRQAFRVLLAPIFGDPKQALSPVGRYAALPGVNPKETCEP